MENNKNKKSVKFQGDMLNYCDFIQVFVFTSYHHLKIALWTYACLIKQLMSRFDVTLELALCKFALDVGQIAASSCFL